MEVNCPACGQRQSGRTENELSAKLQAHMMGKHGLRGACDLHAPSTGLVRQCAPSSSGELADLPFEERLEAEAHREEGMIYPGEDVMQAVRCPLCGRTVIGHDLTDLSSNLKRHMKDEHALAH